MPIRTTVKEEALINDLKEKYEHKHICVICKISEWMGRQVPIKIYYINGNKKDNRIENLKFICFNCYSVKEHKQYLTYNT